MSLESQLPGSNLKMANPENPNIDWKTLAQATRAVEPVVWKGIRNKGTPAPNDDVVSFAGYLLFRGRFENFPPRIIIRAELILPEKAGVAHPDHVDNLVLRVSGNYNLKVGIVYNYPFRSGALERDRVFGATPEMPPSISYSLSLDRKPFIIQS